MNVLLLWAALDLAPGVRLEAGAINAVTFEREGHRLAVYGGRGPAEEVLFTHARRDVLRSGTALAAKGARAVVPAGEAGLFRDPAAFWKKFETERFHDYEARASKVPVTPVAVSREVKGGDTVEWRGLRFAVLDTPGYTAGAVSYVAQAGGRTFAFTGDLIYGDGRLPDLYSLQTGVPAAKTRGYHGYGARAAALLASLKTIEAAGPDVIVPVRGPVIRDPRAAIGRLRDRLVAVFREHFATDALRWYWGDDNLRIRARGILPEGPIAWMAMSETRKLPEWVIPIQNSRLIVSASGAAYLIDCGNARIFAEVERLRQAGRFRKLEGLFITHYHDDHTDYAQRAAETAGIPVHFSPELRDVLENPAGYRLPAMTANPIRAGQVRSEGQRVQWHEFEFEYRWHPGQTLYHGGLIVRRAGEDPLFFVGDSFTPSGLDDYCLNNRNLLGERQGYAYCLRALRELGPHWLINQHVEPMFRFTAAQLGEMEASLGKRNRVLRELFPFDDPNYGVDEHWLRFASYGVRGRTGETLQLPVVVLNHSPRRRTFAVTVAGTTRRVTVEPGREATATFSWRVTPGQAIATASVRFDDGTMLEDWAEAMVTGEDR